MDKFGVEHKDFETFMEDWFDNEEWLVKEGEIYIPPKYMKDP